MLIDLETKDFVKLILSTHPSFEQMSNKIVNSLGEMRGGGHNSEYWGWDRDKLYKLSESDLWMLYKWLNNPLLKPKTQEELRIEMLDKEISEIKSIMEDGIHRQNQGQVDARYSEIKRLELLKTLG